MNNIAIFGGAFNPVTIGHGVVALGVRAKTGYSVTFMPCYKHRFGKELAPAEHRLVMCNLMCEALGNYHFKTDPLEIDLQHNGSTYQLLRRMTQMSRYAHTKLAFVVGKDNLAHFSEWDRAADLLREFQLIIVNRPGHEENGLVLPKNAIRPINVEIAFPGSSTDVRELFSTGCVETASRYLHNNVFAYIINHQLYGRNNADLSATDQGQAEEGNRG